MHPNKKIIRNKGFGKCGSQHVYNTTPKSKKWLTINYVVNVVGTTLPRFYIFRGEKIRDDYIQLCKLGTCMAMQSKTWIPSFSRIFCHFSKGLCMVKHL